MSQRSEQLARQFEEAVSEFTRTVQACSDEQWAAVCNAEGWTVAQTAQHVSGQFPVEMAFITAAAEAKPVPSMDWDELNTKNEGRAANNVSATKAQVINEFESAAPSIAEYIRALTDEQLERAPAVGLADGAAVSTQQMLEGGFLIAHLTGHLESIRNAGAVAARGI